MGSICYFVRLLLPPFCLLLRALGSKNDRTNTMRPIRRLTEGGFERPRNGKKNDKAHPPIHPTNHVGNLEGNDKKVYDLVTRRFLACCSKNARGMETVVDVEIAGEEFTAKGTSAPLSIPSSPRILHRLLQNCINPYGRADDPIPQVSSSASGIISTSTSTINGTEISSPIFKLAKSSFRVLVN